MKKDIHPKYYPNATVKCTCGNTFHIGATQELIKTEACSQCHPFYTGGKRNLDKVGRVQKFKAKLEKQKRIKEKTNKKRKKDKKGSMKKKEESQEKKNKDKKKNGS